MDLVAIYSTMAGRSSKERFSAVPETNGVHEMAFERYLTDEEFRWLLEICEILHLADYRDELSRLFPHSFKLIMPLRFVPKAQLIADLDKLDTTFSIDRNGSPFVPLKAWLEEACSFGGGRDEERELKQLISKVEAVFQAHLPEKQLQHAERLSAIARETMRIIYMPFVTKHLVENNSDVRSLAQAIDRALDRQFRYNQKVYVRNLQRTITVEWADELCKQISVRVESRFEFVPFTHEPIVWKTQRFSSGELSSSDYTTYNDDIELEAGAIEHIEEVVSADGQVTTTTHTLPLLDPGSPYVIVSDRKSGWKLDSDPTYEQTSPYVVDGTVLKIRNLAEGIRLVYHDVAGTGLLLPELNEQRCTPNWDVISFGAEIALKSEYLLLPGQGYMVVISRNGEA
ncbi:hypothetical protein [Rhizobium leguminosarum]|uniref:hypothetical protein n=1 Tax=Rhizobium leguminosarum TaxID=384 RepID=UPI001C967372|nr:hypothetical protein [Rhizobium leguminosarum]MBY5515658.1 hypothetical protein [Rhizobium leguminosarum]